MTQLWKHADLVWMLVVRNLKIRYKNSALGFLWTLLGPVFMIAIYWLFLGIMRFQIDLPVLVTGIIVWQFLAMCLGDALNAITGNANLVKKTAFPRVILVLAQVLANAINFLLSLLVLAAYLLIIGHSWGPALWLLPGLLALFALVLGVSLFVAALNVYFRDTEHILGMVQMAWFFVTPVIYPISLVTARFEQWPWLQWAYFLNPMAGLVCMFRRFFLGEDLGPVSGIGLSFLVSVAVLALGWFAFQTMQKRFAEEL